jgi:hypothetical protein
MLLVPRQLQRAGMTGTVPYYGEHLWAGPLRAAIASAGGTPLEEAWLAPPELATLDALMANSES